MDTRKHYAEKYLKGEGIEFGALHNPLPVNQERCRVRYVDRYPVNVVLRLFPELKLQAHEFVRSDFLLDMDRDGFDVLGGGRYDFFIANHVIEHLVNPLRFLEKLHGVMPEGSILYLAVPDKRYTFDINRAVTPSEHLWQDYLDNTLELSDEHLLDFLRGTGSDLKPKRGAARLYNGNWLPWNWETVARKRLHDWHRRRSIHVHVWDQPAFDEFLALAIERVPLGFSILERCSSADTDKHEMLYILKKGPPEEWPGDEECTPVSARQCASGTP